ncbi:NAD(P)-binding domain-containing protein [Rhizobium sp. S152]|uniref:NADPH-dependent F420 reductase n=1 Tax=Rhizobium sp. S152 TaxID=3055038 RepID=UPI0025A9D1E7|nr:NAD(P)-binding domain-containing protein [Rhizobium sp. S152]MDM9628504.1 NAD(P)-binding domain-containing protein [Rhizobium sp. S152]
MKIGMIGAGAVALAIAKQCLANGHEVVLSNRSGRTKAIDDISGPGSGLTLGSIQEAARQEIVFLSVPWLQVGAALSQIDDWEGRTLVDTTNPFTQIEPTLVLADLGEESASEIVAQLAPSAKVVKAFNSIYISRFEEGAKRPGGTRVLFVSGDHAEPKDTIAKLIETFGFVAVDLGGLKVGGRLQQPGGPLAGRDFLVA